MQNSLVLIGPVANDPTESVSAVNRSLIEGLSDRYTFVPSRTNRRFGATAQARVNVLNLAYLAKHFTFWVWNLVRHRPAIAHYAINCGSALWKGLLFLRVARLFGARTVGHLHSGGFLDYWNTLPQRRRRAAMAEFARLDAFVVLSERWKDAMAAQVGVPSRLLHVVNNPIDAVFEDTALKFPIDRNEARSRIVTGESATTARYAITNAAQAREPNEVKFLAMGVMSRDKGVIDLVHACAQVKTSSAPFQLHLAGPEREAGIHARIHGQLVEHGLEDTVRLPGSVRGGEKLRLFREASVSILPSYYENFPLVLLEAAAAGHAIIATPVGAVPEFFADGVSAIFVEPGNVGQIAEAMTRLLANPAERFRLAREARMVFSRRLARGEIMDSLHRVYCSIVSREQKEMGFARPWAGAPPKPENRTVRGIIGD